MKSKEFYAKIGKWDFSEIQLKTKHITDWRFYSKIREYSDESSLCLDVGTGGGEKVLRRYPDVGYIIATDYVEEMVKTAKKNLAENGKKNVTFTQMDTANMTFPKEMFDLISARHTKINGKQMYECLKPGGVIVIEGVDKADCQELKEMFGRGQAYLDKVSISDMDREELLEAGFEILEDLKIYEEEYFLDAEELYAFLGMVPILDGFSEETEEYEKKEIEKDIFENYVKEYTTEEGILLKRVLYGIVAKKVK